MISVIVNGKTYQLDRPIRLDEYLEERGLANRSLAVAINGEVVPRAQHGEAVLSDGDRVEIVRPVGGG